MPKSGTDLKWHSFATITKYSEEDVQRVRDLLGDEHPHADDLADLAHPYETVTSDGNLLTTAGVTRLAALITGSGSGHLDNTHVRVGVGDDSTAANVSDTDLSTGSNQYYVVMEATYPTLSAGEMTFKGQFETGEANFAWNCWGLDVQDGGSSDGGTVSTPLINRKVQSLGTKSTGVWVLTVTVTIS